jgi:predicted ArsR family transcriptional regulator
MIFEGDDPYIPEKVSFAQIDKASEMPPSGWLKKAIAALKEKPNQTSQDLANALGTSNENLRKYISGWAKNGYIEVSPIKTGRAFTYRVAKDGEALL